MFNLFMNSNKKRAKRRGFTLIELVIVIVILGILAGVAALSFSDVTKSSKDGVARANLRAIKSAVQIAIVDNKGEFPVIENPAAPNAKHLGLGKIVPLLESDLLSKPEGYIYKMQLDSGNLKLTVEREGATSPEILETYIIKK